MLLNYVNPLRGLFYMLKLVEYFMIYFFVCSVLNSKNQIKLFLKVFFVTFGVVIVYAVTRIGLEGRVSAPFEGAGEPNTLGGYLVLMQGIILGVATFSKSSRQRAMLISLVLFSMIPLVFTLSRSSYMAFVPMYLILVFFNKTKRKNILIGGAIITLVLSIFFFPQNVRNRLAYTFIPAATQDAPPQKILGIEFGPSSSARIFSWKVKIEKWKASPLFGYGLTGQGFIDGQYVRTLVETGAFGFSAFILLLGAMFKNVNRIFRSLKDDLYKGIALGFLAGHVGMLFHAISANTYIIVRIMEPYWFLAAVVMMLPKVEKAEMPKLEDIPKDVTKFFRNSDRLLTNGRLRLKGAIAGRGV